MQPRRRHQDLALEDDARATDWYAFLVAIDDLVATGKFTWAEELLQGIKDTVTRTSRVTPVQRAALANIEQGQWPWKGRAKVIGRGSQARGGKR